MNWKVRDQSGDVVAAFVEYEHARNWANSQGPGHPIVKVDDE